MKKSINESWEQFKDRLYTAAQQSELRSGWLWQITKPKGLPSIKEICAYQIGGKVVIFQVLDQGFICFEENKEAKFDDIITALYKFPSVPGYVVKKQSAK